MNAERHQHHLSRDTLTRIRRRAVGGEELVETLRHVSICDECSSQVTAGIGFPAEVVPELDEQHLDPDAHIIPYVDDAVDRADREIIETHLDDCAMCRNEVADLRPYSRTQRQRTWIATTFAIAAMLAAVALALLFSSVDQMRPDKATARVATHPKPDDRVDPQPAASQPAQSRPAATQAADAPTQPAPAPRHPLVAEAIERERLPYPADLAELNPPADILRGGGSEELPRLTPAGIVVADSRPRFSWPAYEGAAYIVSIFEHEQEVARSARLTQPRWRPARAMRRGRTYVWQVEVLLSNANVLLPAPPAPPAMFRIAGEAQVRDIHAALERFPKDHLLHAVLYAKSGLVDDARAALRRAVDAGDADAERIARSST